MLSDAQRVVVKAAYVASLRDTWVYTAVREALDYERVVLGNRRCKLQAEMKTWSSLDPTLTSNRSPEKRDGLAYKPSISFPQSFLMVLGYLTLVCGLCGIFKTHPL